MKKTLTAFIAFLLVLSLCACAKTPEDFLSAGVDALAQGNWEEAIEKLEEVLKQEPDNIEALHALSLARYNSGDNEGFLAAYDKLIELGAPVDDTLRDAWHEAMNYEIAWAEASMESAVREYLAKPGGAVTRNDLDGIGGICTMGGDCRFVPVGATDDEFLAVRTELMNSRQENSAGSALSSVEDFKHFINLERMSCEFNNVEDISPLAGLTGLTFLRMSVNRISDISPLAGLTGLTSLQISANKISDISPLSGLANLKILWLGANNISDISPLAGLTGLEELLLHGNSISDISCLSGLANLAVLNLSANSISDSDASQLKEQLPNCDIILA